MKLSKQSLSQGDILEKYMKIFEKNKIVCQILHWKQKITNLVLSDAAVMKREKAAFKHPAEMLHGITP